MTCGHERPETTIPASPAIIRALGKWLAPGGGHDEQDAFVELLVKTHAHPDYHPDDLGDLGDICKIVVVSVGDETAEWHIQNGANRSPCKNRLSAHGPLLDTPPAVDGDTLCAPCRGDAARLLRGAYARADAIAEVIHAAGAELLDQPFTVSLAGGEGGTS